MTVTLLHHTPLVIADTAIGKCWNKGCMPTPEAAQERMDRVANKHKHASTIEHLTYNFDIDGISRACLQELARHRISSFSVKSSRYTLSELKKAPSLRELYDIANDEDSSLYDTAFWKVCEQFVIRTSSEHVDWSSCASLMRLQEMLLRGISNDIAKYCMPESYKTSLIWSVNARSLQNFLSLRSDKAALWEIRNLAHAIYDTIPEDHKFLFQDHIKE